MSVNNLFPSKDITIDIKRFFLVLKSWAWLVLMIAVLLGGVAYLFTRSQKPVYTATAIMMISGYSTGGTSNYDTVYTGGMLALSYSHILGSTEILSKVATQVGGGLTYKDVKSAVTITAIRDTQLIQIEVEHQDPVLAAKIANTLIDVFTERLKSDYANSTSQTRENLRTRIQVLNQQITSLQNEIQQKMTSNRDERIKVINSTIATLQQEITQLSDDVARLQYDVALVNAKDPTGRKIIVTATPSVEEQSKLAIKNAELNQQIEKLRLYQQQYVLLNTNGDSTPNSDPAIVQIQSYLSQLQGMSLNLGQNLESLQPSNLLMPPSLPQVYRAEVPKEAKQPKTLIFTALGFLIGLFIAAVGVYLLEMLDPRMKDPELITRKYGLPVLASHYKTRGSGDTLLKQSRSSSQIYESCRLLRLKVLEQERAKSVLLTGPTAGDECDSLAANLAVVMAQSGTGTLLLDTNMHRSKIPHLFGQAVQTGLGEVLSGSVQSINDVACKTELPCLSVIYAGGLTPAQVNLFNGQRGEELMRELEERYEFIVVNAPPLLSTNDALLLAPFTNNVILVVKPDRSPWSSIKQAVEKMLSIGVKPLGVVFNNISSRRYQIYFQDFAFHPLPGNQAE